MQNENPQVEKSNKEPISSVYEDLEFADASEKLVRVYGFYKKVLGEFNEKFPAQPGYRWEINSFGELTQIQERRVQ